MQLDTQKHEVSQYLRSAHANRHAEARVSRCMYTRHAEGQVDVEASYGMARSVYLVLVLLCENLVVVLVVVCRSLLPQVPPASPIEDRGTAIPIEDRDRAIPKRLHLCGVIVKGLPVSLIKDHSARGTVGAGVDWTSFAKDSFSRYIKGEEISADTYATLRRHQLNLKSLGDRLQKMENTTATMKEK
ncbi:hypothetical protein F2Q69_00050000 [Brassica cretica]|uniref:Uncharacterized protein n=1 Tax=Brassica cretica TaxID=69181 RepID=A0A8S9PXT3_BRACR|nr:hypothetical protein F2Q69_00050000 [Brassica cretica]